MSMPGPLTTAEYWNEKWGSVQLPVVAGSDRGDVLTAPIVEMLVRHGALARGQRVLEIGGAPGGFVARLTRDFGVHATLVDISAQGCEKARENFRLLNIDAEVVCADVLNWHPRDEPFDLVYSLGVVEHFRNVPEIVAAHARLTARKGTIAIGMPNFVRLLAPLFRRWAPKELEAHNLSALDMRTWRDFDQRLGLVELYKGYLGGVQPRVAASLGHEGSPTWPFRAAAFLARRETAAYARRRVKRHGQPANTRINHRLFSAYEVAIFRVVQPAPSLDDSRLREAR